MILSPFECFIISILNTYFHVSTLEPEPEYNILYEVLLGFYVFLKLHLPFLK